MGVLMEAALLAAFWGLTSPAPPAAAPDPPGPARPAPIWEPAQNAPKTPDWSQATNSPVSVPALLDDAARRWGISPVRFRRIAACESTTGTNPRAYSWTAPHRGVMQWDRVSWAERAPLAGISPNWDVAFDDWANIEVSAHTMAAGQWGRWACK